MITILIGKSGVGKDTIQNEMCTSGDWERLVTATTRPMREGEQEGKDYFFMRKKDFFKGVDDGKFIEHRSYDTLVNGNPDTWYYGMPKQELRNCKDYVTIVDVDGSKALIDYYGRKNCFVVSIEVSSKIREDRAIIRGSFDKAEWDRRFSDDESKFSQEAVSEVVNFHLENTGDVNDAVCVIKDASNAYILAERKKGEQYIVESCVIGGYSDNLAPPEEGFKAFNRAQYDK